MVAKTRPWTSAGMGGPGGSACSAFDIVPPAGTRMYRMVACLVHGCTGNPDLPARTAARRAGDLDPRQGLRGHDGVRRRPPRADLAPDLLRALRGPRGGLPRAQRGDGRD